jgi:hypothetical protein
MNNKYNIPTENIKAVYGQMQAEDILRKIDILSLLRSFGIEVEDKGESYIARCPFHKAKEKEGKSLSISKEKKIYNCFSCGASGDLVDFVIKIRNCSFDEAINYLKNKEYARKSEDKDYVLSVLDKVRQVGLKETSELIKKGKLAFKGKDKEDSTVFSSPSLLKDVQNYYMNKINCRESIELIRKLKLNNLALLHRFNIGYCDGTLVDILSLKQKEELQRLNILDKENKEILLNCITIPVLDERGDIINIAGINVGKQIKVNGNAGVFNRSASKVYPDKVILAGNLIDALYLLSMGFNNVQSLFLKDSLDCYIDILKEDRVETVILILEDKYTKDRLLSEGFNVKVIALDNSLYEQMDKEKVDNLIKEALLIESPVKKEFNAKLNDDGSHVVEIGDIIYTVVNVKDIFTGNCKVTIKAYNKVSGDSFVDMVELYSSRSRNSYSNILGRNFNIESKVIERDLNAILSYLEKIRDKKIYVKEDVKKVEVSEEERQMGMKLLKDPFIMEQIVKDMEEMGYIGDDLNKQLLYLTATSRKLDDPISVIIVSESSSGKSYLIETVEKLMPPEDVISATSLSDQALNYIAKDGLKHKFLTLGEAIHSESVEHQIREMLSSKKLSRLVTVKDERSGEMLTKLMTVDATVATAMSTTGNGVNPENASRCFLVNVDESEDQTKKIHDHQRKEYGFYSIKEDKERVDKIIKKHHCAQRLLKERVIVNPYADKLKFPSKLMRTRRDHKRFLLLLLVICFLRQYQKEEKKIIENGKEIEFIECDEEDYRIGYTILVNKILNSTFGEISVSDIEFYEEIRNIARKKSREQGLKINDVGFTQREIRENTDLHFQWIKMHLKKLVDYEYISYYRSNERGSRNIYKLRADEDIDRIRSYGITTPEELREILKDKQRADLLV